MIKDQHSVQKINPLAIISFALAVLMLIVFFAPVLFRCGGRHQGRRDFPAQLLFHRHDPPRAGGAGQRGHGARPDQKESRAGTLARHHRDDHQCRRGGVHVPGGAPADHPVALILSKNRRPSLVA